MASGQQIFPHKLSSLNMAAQTPISMSSYPQANKHEALILIANAVMILNLNEVPRNVK